MWNEEYDKWLRELHASPIDEGKIKTWVIDWGFNLEELTDFTKELVLREAREHSLK